MHFSTNNRRRASGALIAALLLVLPIITTMAQTATQEQEQIVPTELDLFTQADAELVLTLNEAIDVALEKSFSVYQLKQSYLRSAYGLEIAQRNLKTRIDFNSTIPSISQGVSPRVYFNPVTQQEELSYLRSGNTNFNGRISIMQPLITDGTVSLSARLSGYDSFNERIGDQPDLENRSMQPTIGINFTQPLFQYNSIKNTLRSAELSFESLDATYTQSELAQLNQITNQFWALFQSQKRLENLAESFLLSETNYTTGVRKYLAGLIAEVEKMSLEVQWANDLDQLEQQKNAHEEQQFTFNRAMGLPLETKIWVDASEEYVPIEVDMDRALQLAFTNRADIRLQEISIEQQEMSLAQTISSGRPDLNINAGYDLTGTSTLSGLGIDDSWGDHLSEAFNKDNRSPNTNVSLTLRIPVFDWGRNKAQVERSMVSLETSQRQMTETEENLKRDVINRVRAVEASMRSMEIQVQNQVISERTYEIERTRFDRGEITITVLLQRQQQYNNTKAAFLSALIGYERAKASLKEITLWDWETNQAAVRRTTPPTPFSRGGSN